MKNLGIQLEDENKEHLMDLALNVIKDTSGQIVNGLMLGNTLEQNKALILIAHAGEFRLDPTLGVGISDMLLDSDYLEFRHKIRQHFAIDDLEVSKLDLYPNKPIVIEANYK